MANFVGLDKSVAKAAEACAWMNDRADTAAFLVMQQDMLQEGAIAARKENKAKAAGGADGSKGTVAAKQAMTAYERMKALKKN